MRTRVDKGEYPIHMSNWVQKRAFRDRYLRDSITLWQEVRSAVDECCNSFREHYIGVARVTNQEQNGHRVLVTIRPTYEPNNPRQVSIKFDSEEKQITATVDGGRADVFPIDADENHAFLTHQNKEINADEFTQIVLEDALFSSPSKTVSIGITKSGTYST